MNTKTPIFSKTDNAKFFRTLNKRVNDYFKERNLKRTGNWKLHLKTIIMFTLFLAPYFFLISLEMPLGLFTFKHHYWCRNGWSWYECNARWQSWIVFNQILGK